MLVPYLHSSSSQGENDAPPVFCWTKMGTEAGQTLDTILRRKELERRAGGGLFAWGIGSSLGVTAKLAQQEVQSGEIDVLFTPMRSAAKNIDVEPSQVLIWLGYLNENREEIDLPSHMVVTSRGNFVQAGSKCSHYALLCNAHHDLTVPANIGVIDANRARNFVSLNPLGASQVTAVVRYLSRHEDLPEKFYPITFRAKMHGAGFVRLVSPVALDGELASFYHQLCKSTTAEEWAKGAAHLRQKANDAKSHEVLQMQRELFKENSVGKTQPCNHSGRTCISA